MRVLGVVCMGEAVCTCMVTVCECIGVAVDVVARTCMCMEVVCACRW